MSCQKGNLLDPSSLYPKFAAVTVDNSLRLNATPIGACCTLYQGLFCTLPQPGLIL